MSIPYNNKGEEYEGEIVSISNLNLKNGSDIILDNVSFKIKKGDFLGIIGPNGAGKTTLFKCMLGLNKNFSGTIRIFNKDVKKEYKKIDKKIRNDRKKKIKQRHIERNCRIYWNRRIFR